MVSLEPTTKATKKQPRRTRTEQEVLAEIKKLASELADHDARNPHQHGSAGYPGLALRQGLLRSAPAFPNRRRVQRSGGGSASASHRSEERRVGKECRS